MVNEWTRDDLPAVFDDSRRPGRPWNPSPDLMSDLAAWLNEHHPKPEPGRWRRFHSIVEAERDQARESLREACKVAQSLNVEAHQATKRAESAERERDAARDDERLHSWGRITRHPFFDSIQFASGGLTDAMLAALDEAHQPAPAEARTAPAVTRAEVEQAVRSRPWKTHGADSQGYEIIHVESAVDAVCDLLGIEAGQATGPVEELAGQIEAATRTAIRQVCVDLATIAPSLDPLTVERAMEVTAASRKVAAHVLGQGADQ